MAPARHELAHIAYAQGEYDTAKAYLQQSAQLYAPSNNEFGMAKHHTLSGYLLRDQARHANRHEDQTEAQRHFEQALRRGLKVQALPLIIDALVGYASLFIERSPDTVDRATEWLLIAAHHPSSAHDTRERAQGLLSSVVANLADDALSAMQQRAETQDLESVVEQLLAAR